MSENTQIQKAYEIAEKSWLAVEKLQEIGFKETECTVLKNDTPHIITLEKTFMRGIGADITVNVKEGVVWIQIFNGNIYIDETEIPLDNLIAEPSGSIALVISVINTVTLSERLTKLESDIKSVQDTGWFNEATE